MRFIIIIIAIVCSMVLNSCAGDKKIDTHFYLMTGDIGDDVGLNYVNNNDYIFLVVQPKVVSYVKCGNYLFIIQHPLVNDKVDETITNYFVIDSKIDYSDERLQPQSVSESEFNEKLKKICNGIPIKNL